METTIEWGEIQGRPITFPMEVRTFNAVTMGFSVARSAASALLPGDAFELVEIGDGIAQFILSICDYRDNPWGDYNEVNLGFLTRPAGAPMDVIGSFVYRMPVDQAFTCEAGNAVMGFPKTVERIDVSYDDTAVRAQLWQNDDVALAVEVPRVVQVGPRTRMDSVSYSYLDGVPYGTPLSIELGRGVVDPSEVRVELGTGQIADELRSLGLPATPDFCGWGEDLSATFLLGHPV
ncbi:MAG: acetoacetate decarboxylase family protein [Acidimicrobiia bacterium]|nr:acetoacetate decarboxylase family protein [Acidimicrobiia bacterium]